MTNRTGRSRAFLIATCLLSVGCSLTATLASPLTANLAHAECKPVTVSATGKERSAIDDATSSATDALAARIAHVFGAGWSMGPHRGGSYTCRMQLGYKAGWTCTATTRQICRPPR